MEIEKSTTIPAPRSVVWELLLDPTVMGNAVPGMESIEVVNEDEYVANIHVKISFISARFKIRTKIVEKRAPEYLKSEGSGEDSSVTSSLKQSSEVFLEDSPQGGTALRMRVNVDVLGRLGTFGLNVMKTKADRMWQDFVRNLGQAVEEKLSGSGVVPASPAAPRTDIGVPATDAPPMSPDALVAPTQAAPASASGVSAAADERDYLWRHFAFNAEQRLKAFNFFVVLSVVAFGGVFAAIERKVPGPAFVLAGGFVAVLSIVFWLLDARSKGLLELPLRGLMEYEKRLPYHSRVFTRDGQTHRSVVSYTFAFRALFLLQLLFGLGTVVYGAGH